jgi:hypothetical protein
MAASAHGISHESLSRHFVAWTKIHERISFAGALQRVHGNRIHKAEYRT